MSRDVQCNLIIPVSELFCCTSGCNCFSARRTVRNRQRCDDRLFRLEEYGKRWFRDLVVVASNRITCSSIYFRGVST